MTTEEFNQLIKRHIALREYTQAFVLCLSNINTPALQSTAIETGKKMIKDYGYNVMHGSGNKRWLNVPLELSLEWIIDIAISLGYNTLDRGAISTGLMSSCPAVSFGTLLAKQKFGIKRSKTEFTALWYSFGSFSNDSKLINALCNDIIDRLKVKDYGN